MPRRECLRTNPARREAALASSVRWTRSHEGASTHAQLAQRLGAVLPLLTPQRGGDRGDPLGGAHHLRHTVGVGARPLYRPLLCESVRLFLTGRSRACSGGAEKVEQLFLALPAGLTASLVTVLASHLPHKPRVCEAERVGGGGKSALQQLDARRPQGLLVLVDDAHRPPAAVQAHAPCLQDGRRHERARCSGGGAAAGHGGSPPLA